MRKVKLQLSKEKMVFQGIYGVMRCITNHQAEHFTVIGNWKPPKNCEEKRNHHAKFLIKKTLKKS